MKDYQGIIDAAKSSIKAKQLAAQLIPRFFKFFPDLSGPALECHLDLLEEEDLGVSCFSYICDMDCLVPIETYNIPPSTAPRTPPPLPPHTHTIT